MYDISSLFKVPKKSSCIADGALKSDTIDSSLFLIPKITYLPCSKNAEYVG